MIRYFALVIIPFVSLQAWSQVFVPPPSDWISAPREINAKYDCTREDGSLIQLQALSKLNHHRNYAVTASVRSLKEDGATIELAAEYQNYTTFLTEWRDFKFQSDSYFCNDPLAQTVVIKIKERMWKTYSELSCWNNQSILSTETIYCRQIR